MYYDENNECPMCNLSFSKKYNLQRHVLKGTCKRKQTTIKSMEQDGYILSLPSTETMKKDILKCEYCSKLFIKKFNFDRHLLSTIGDCYKLRTKNQEIINNQINHNIVNNNQIYNNHITNIQTNIQNTNIIQLQPVIEKVVLAKHGEETISHITKDIMLEILDIESFPEMCTELMRLLYFNKEVPENRNWTIVYPKNQNAGVEYNHKTLRFERKKTYNIIDDKFSNMVNLLFDLVQEISRDDIENNNLSKRQKINVNKYCMHYGQLDISKTSKVVYDSIHSLAYNSRKDQMKEWGESGHKGNHLSLKF